MCLKALEHAGALIGGDEVVQRGCLLRALLTAHPKGVRLNHMPTQHLNDGNDASGIRDKHAILEMELFGALRELQDRQDGVLSVVRQLVSAKLGDEVVAPSIVVLGVVDDDAADLAVVHDRVADVGTGQAFLYPLEAVVLELCAQRLVEVDLRALTKFLSRLLLQGALQFADLLRQFLRLSEGLGSGGAQGGGLVGFEGFPLFLYAIERFTAIDIFRRFDLDLGKTLRDKAPSAVTALSRLKQVKEYVKETVAAAFRKMRDAGSSVTAGRVNQIVREALRETFEVFEGYAE